MACSGWLALATVLLGVARSLPAQHNALLPQPQEIRYGSGRLALQGLGIRFASSPGLEDEFAAEELSRFLSARAHVPIPVRDRAAEGPAITLDRTGAPDPLPVPGEQAGVKSRESYRLQVTSSGVEIRSPSSTGLFYGAQTLRQLVEGEGKGAALPEVEIRDWPALAYRGVMMDMSHGGLPSEDEVKRQIDFLSRWKANQYYFYSEASVELEGYPLLNPRGRFSQDQVRRIVAYGRARHIDVIPCLELYGHLHDLFRVEKYSELAVSPHGGEFDPRNPRVREVLTHWADQFTRLFPSPFVHIGFDETWQIEQTARQYGPGTTPASLYLEHLTYVHSLFEQRGKKVLAWADMMLKYPEILPNLPAGIIAVPWHYEPEKDFGPWLSPLAERHIPQVIATAVRSWNQVVPDFSMTSRNIDTFIAAGRQAGTLGLINTVWTDVAQNLLRLAWPGMAYGAVASWQTTPVDRERFLADYARVMYPPEVAREAGNAFDRLASAELSLQQALGGDTMVVFWDDPFTPARLKRSADHRADLREARLLAEEAEESLDRALALGGDPETLSSFLVGSRMVDYAGLKFLNALEVAEWWQELGPRPSREQWRARAGVEVFSQSHSRLVDLMDAITELRELYRTAWLAELTPYRLDSALGRWDAEYEYWRKLQARFQSLRRTYRPGELLPPIESLAGSP